MCVARLSLTYVVWRQIMVVLSTMSEIRSVTSPNSNSSRPFFAPQLERFAHIRQVQVPEKFQRIGVGRKLMVEAIERLKSEGVEQIVLATAESNTKARSLYEDLGFRESQKQVQYKLSLGRK